jgi:hypothetical protein
MRSAAVYLCWLQARGLCPSVFCVCLLSKRDICTHASCLAPQDMRADGSAALPDFARHPQTIFTSLIPRVVQYSCQHHQLYCTTAPHYLYPPTAIYPHCTPKMSFFHLRSRMPSRFYTPSSWHRLSDSLDSFLTYACSRTLVLRILALTP